MWTCSEIPVYLQPITRLHIMDFAHINFAAIAVGTVLSFILGLIWYAQPVFGRIWQRHSLIPPQKLRDGKGLLRIGPAIVLTFLSGVMLDVILPTELMQWDDGAVVGLLVGLAIVAPALGIHYLFGRKSVQLFLIDAGFSVFSLLILGAVLAAMS